MRILALELTRDRLALLNADMKCPPREVGQALPNPSPQGRVVSYKEMKNMM